MTGSTGRIAREAEMISEPNALVRWFEDLHREPVGYVARPPLSAASM